jgi:hypothetical protein
MSKNHKNTKNKQTRMNSNVNSDANKQGNQTNRLQSDGVNEMSNYLSKIPKSIAIVADRSYFKLKYTQIGAQAVAVGAQSTYLRFRPTAAFDIDPLLGGTAMPGFIEWTGFYSSYRVTWSRMTLRVTPTATSTPLLICLLPMNIDLGGTPSAATIVSLPDQPYAKSKLLGIAGSPTITLSSEMSTEKIYGSKMVYVDDNFASLVTTVPNNNWFWSISSLTSVAAVATQTFFIEYSLDVGCEFYDRKQLQN